MNCGWLLNPDREQEAEKKQEVPYMFGCGVYIVLGGAGGVGKRCVERCVKCGKNVAFMDIDKAAGKALKAKLEKEYGVNVFFFHGDVNSEEDRELFESAVIAMYGRIERFISNVSSFKVDFIVRTN